ncbi:DNA repair protein RecO [Ichthyenterobacterium magnum]|uniref:DNA repair protein RecO n=1 Tax=Ichthyenterobacterium magnum TaxID=1230530 RepID=A0A420DXU2_9FLAO|nr:DNA repair protein RecO [Ichthyenterobacterium magnum]RKE99001.1 DNA replication and repair protein RecO [Ichthyenterobacterium magnum]
MLIKTNAIVLSKIKYRDNDLIVKCYTEKKGVVSYLLRGVLKSKKRNSKIAHFQLLSQLHIEENRKANHSLQTIKESRLAYVYKSAYTSVFKSAIIMFLAEVLSNTLKEEEQNEQLYNYLKTTLQWFDYQDEFSNFHLLFLLNLTKHLGFYPNTLEKNKPYFNISNGLFEPKKEGVYSISGNNLATLKQLLGMKFDRLHTIKLSSKQRQSFLSMILLYFELHLGDFKKPKSLQILNQVFN